MKRIQTLHEKMKEMHGKHKDVPRLKYHRSLDGEVGINLYKTGMTFRREIMQFTAKHGLSSEQWQILMVLKRFNGVLQKDIAGVTIQDAPSVSRGLKRLESRGFVVKKVSSKDKRATKIFLTLKADKVIASIGQKTKKHISDIMKPFSDTKKKQLVKLLKELSLCLENYHKGAGR